MLRGGTYLSFGDSIGYVIADKTGNAEGDLFPFRVANYIRTNKGYVQGLNKHIGGSRTDQLIDYKNWWGNIRADLVTLCIGMNDCANYGSGSTVSVANYTANLQTIVNRLRVVNPNVHIVLCTPPLTIDPGRNTSAYVTAMLTLGYDGDSGASGSANMSTSASRVDVARFDTAWTSSVADLTANMNTIAISSITSNSAGTLLTVTATAHGLSTGAAISIRGSNQSTFNVTYSTTTSGPTITKLTADTFSVAGTSFAASTTDTRSMIGVVDSVHPNRTGYAALYGKVQPLIASDSWLNNLGVIA